jgi:hypothetical protein
MEAVIRARPEQGFIQVRMRALLSSGLQSSNEFSIVKKQLPCYTFTRRPSKDWLGMGRFQDFESESSGVSALRH